MRPFTVLAIVASALPLAGCLEFKQQVAQTLLLSPAEDPAWSPAPMALSLHPATRVRPQGKQWVIDARVRMVDGLGDYTKCSGSWRFELHAVGNAAQHDDLVCLWHDKVRSLEDHKLHFDAATRSYRFVLPLEKELPPSVPVELLVVFSPEGSLNRMACKAQLTK